MCDREVVIFGAGRIGEKFVYQYYDKVNIKCFWDNKKTGELLGYQIKKPEIQKKYFIIVASVFYLEIREQLTKMGYQEFENFIPYQIFHKKMAIAYGNCHMEAIRLYLEQHKEFTLEYGFYPFPMIQDLNDIQWEYGNVLKHCELFFHQSIRKDNVYGEQYSSEHMLLQLQEACDIISVPNLYGMPKYLFPQLDMKSEWQIGSFCPYFIDKNIVLWLKNGKSIKEIKSYICNGGVYKRDEIIDMWENFLEKIDKRERDWSIKVSDYILLQQRKKKIFCDINHITSETAHEIADRILKYMGYDEKNYIELPIMDDLESIIYVDVKEALGLEFEQKNIRKWGKSNCYQTYQMSMDDYIEQICQFTQFCLDRREKY